MVSPTFSDGHPCPVGNQRASPLEPLATPSEVPKHTISEPHDSSGEIRPCQLKPLPDLIP